MDRAKTNPELIISNGEVLNGVALPASWVRQSHPKRRTF